MLSLQTLSQCLLPYWVLPSFFPISGKGQIYPMNISFRANSYNPICNSEVCFLHICIIRDFCPMSSNKWNLNTICSFCLPVRKTTLVLHECFPSPNSQKFLWVKSGTIINSVVHLDYLVFFLKITLFLYSIKENNSFLYIFTYLKGEQKQLYKQYQNLEC